MGGQNAGSVKSSVKQLEEQIEFHLKYTLGKLAHDASAYDYFRALGLVLREPLVDGLWRTEERYRNAGAKRLYYLSLEFLVGRSLHHNLSNLGIYESCEEMLAARGLRLDDLIEAEPEPALGNGGLGRLAACCLESLATLGMPAYGYGINYEFGLFKQEIWNGYQYERPDQWLSTDSPWLIQRADQACLIPVYGRIEHGQDRDGNYNPMWLDWQFLVGVPYEMPVVGYGNRTVNSLRLYSARASNEFDMAIFNSGDYIRAVEQKIASENITKVLYPSDSVRAGKELRLLQEYFLAACAVRDMLTRHINEQAPLDQLPERVAIQLNDTHPALVVAELMRALVDERGVSWEKAWEWTVAICGYTNHTLLPEALEKWPVPLLERVLPRHTQIIFEINRRFLDQVRARWPNDDARAARMSLIEEGPEKQARMAHLAIVGSHATNGVSELHSRLLSDSLVPDFAQMWPERFHSKTNGVTHRRWLVEANPRLACLISDCIGDGWIEDASQLCRLLEHVESTQVQEQFLRTKQECKRRLGELIHQAINRNVDPDFLFDVQVKRIHEYKRQLLNALAIIYDYLSLADDGVPPAVPTLHTFAGKAAPGYLMAKRIIKLIHNVAAVIEHDPRAREHLAVVFLPDYKVSLAEKIIPAADLSEQISTAGTEASGTGSMKLAMNGALTIGTLDGANIEIRDAVGAENIYIFGLTAEQVREARNSHSYNPWDYYHRSDAVRRVVDAISGNRFSAFEPGVFDPIRNALLDGGDLYFHLADLESYLATRRAVAEDFKHRQRWARKALTNIAGMARFSSDRTVAEYACHTWGIRPCRD